MLDDDIQVIDTGELLVEDEQLQEETAPDSEYLAPDTSDPGSESVDIVEEVAPLPGEILDTAPDMVGLGGDAESDSNENSAEQAVDNEEVLQVLQTIQQQQKIGFQNVTLVLTVHTALLCFIIGGLVIWSFLHKLG